MASAPIAYVMGRTDRERRRLLLQASILNPLTERFLLQAGIRPGMRVLDLGCGIGDLALIAARLTGPGGSVVGVDVDDQALEMAESRAAEDGFRNVSFSCADILAYSPQETFDAVIARHVLLHSHDPLAVVRKAASLVRQGGFAAFQEYDLSFWPPSYPEVLLASNLQWAMVELFRISTPHANIGMRLGWLLQMAGLGDPTAVAKCLMDGRADSPFYEWLAETVRSVLPSMEKLGLAPIAGDVETLAQRLREQITDFGSCMTTPLIVSAWACKV